MKPTSDFQGQPDYLVVLKAKEKDEGPIYIGNQKLLAKYKKAIDKDKEKSRYYGRVFYPEVRGDPGSYENNQAYFAGIIDANIPVVLKTDMQYCGNFRTTACEILWLADNGYTFEPDKYNKQETYASPPAVLKEDRMINNYSIDSYNRPDEIKTRLQGIANAVIQARKVVVDRQDRSYSSSSSSKSSDSKRRREATSSSFASKERKKQEEFSKIGRKSRQKRLRMSDTSTSNPNISTTITTSTSVSSSTSKIEDVQQTQLPVETSHALTLKAEIKVSPIWEKKLSDIPPLGEPIKQSSSQSSSSTSTSASSASKQNSPPTSPR